MRYNVKKRSPHGRSYASAARRRFAAQRRAQAVQVPFHACSSDSPQLVTKQLKHLNRPVESPINSSNLRRRCCYVPPNVRDQLRRGAPSAACRGWAARLSASHEEKSAIHCRCACVSGTSSPRDRRIVLIAVSAFWPPEMRAAAATIADRPMPWRQWSATLLPACSPSTMWSTSCTTASREFGTLRSGIGKERNSSPLAAEEADSPARASSASSSGIKSDTTMSMPASRQARVSSSSHSAPRGRGTIPSRPCHGPAIQKTFAPISPILPPLEAPLLAEGRPR